MRRRRILFVMLVLAPVVCAAQEKTWLAGIGRAAILDTYLSQEHYSGIDVNLLHEMTHVYKRDSLMSRTHTYRIDFARTQPRSGARTDYAAMFDYSFGLHRTFSITPDFSIAVGGQGDFFAGGVYNTHGGNNPGQAKLGIDIAPSVRAAYRFHIRRQGLRIDYTASLPLVGVQFSPAYGQSYYEIFSLGDYDRNVCFSSVFNAVNFAQRLTVSLLFRRAALTFGYLGNCRQSELNNIKYHWYVHSFVIGVTL